MLKKRKKIDVNTIILCITILVYLLFFISCVVYAIISRNYFVVAFGGLGGLIIYFIGLLVALFVDLLFEDVNY